MHSYGTNIMLFCRKIGVSEQLTIRFPCTLTTNSHTFFQKTSKATLLYENYHNRPSFCQAEMLLNTQVATPHQLLLQENVHVNTSNTISQFRNFYHKNMVDYPFFK